MQSLLLGCFGRQRQQFKQGPSTCGPVVRSGARSPQRLGEEQGKQPLEQQLKHHLRTEVDTLEPLPAGTDQHAEAAALAGQSDAQRQLELDTQAAAPLPTAARSPSQGPSSRRPGSQRVLLDGLVCPSLPTAVTVFSFQGMPIHQNPGSVAYLGDWSATAGGRSLLPAAGEADVLLMQVFAFEPAKCERMLHEMVREGGGTWRDVVRVPPSLVPPGQSGSEKSRRQQAGGGHSSTTSTALAASVSNSCSSNAVGPSTVATSAAAAAAAAATTAAASVATAGAAFSVTAPGTGVRSGGGTASSGATDVDSALTPSAAAAATVAVAAAGPLNEERACPPAGRGAGIHTLQGHLPERFDVIPRNAMSTRTAVMTVNVRAAATSAAAQRRSQVRVRTLQRYAQSFAPDLPPQGVQSGGLGGHPSSSGGAASAADNVDTTPRDVAGGRAVAAAAAAETGVVSGVATRLPSWQLLGMETAPAGGAPAPALQKLLALDGLLHALRSSTSSAAVAREGSSALLNSELLLQQDTRPAGHSSQLSQQGASSQARNRCRGFTGSSAAEEESCYHEVCAARAFDQLTKQDVIILAQYDVTAKVMAERNLAVALVSTDHSSSHRSGPAGTRTEGAAGITAAAAAAVLGGKSSSGRVSSSAGRSDVSSRKSRAGLAGLGGLEARALRPPTGTSGLGGVDASLPNTGRGHVASRDAAVQPSSRSNRGGAPQRTLLVTLGGHGGLSGALEGLEAAVERAAARASHERLLAAPHVESPLEVLGELHVSSSFRGRTVGSTVPSFSRASGLRQLLPPTQQTNTAWGTGIDSGITASGGARHGRPVFGYASPEHAFDVLNQLDGADALTSQLQAQRPRGGTTVDYGGANHRNPQYATAPARLQQRAQHAAASSRLHLGITAGGLCVGIVGTPAESLGSGAGLAGGGVGGAEEGEGEGARGTGEAGAVDSTRDQYHHQQQQ